MRNTAFVRTAYCGCSLFIQCHGFLSNDSFHGAVIRNLSRQNQVNNLSDMNIKRLARLPVYQQETLNVKVPPTRVVQTTAYQQFIPQHKLDSFRTGSIPIIYIPSIFPSELIDQIKNDAKALELFGGGVQSAGVAKGFGLEQNIRKDVHQLWLSTPDQVLCVDSTPYVGDLSARQKLFDTVEQIRRELAHGTNNSDDTDSYFLSESERGQRYYDSLWGSKTEEISISIDEQNSNIVQGIDILHPSHIELSYLSYSKGSFYRRHVDRIKSEGGQKRISNRIVSFILYLGSDDDVFRNWDPNRDGGCLRVYGKENVECLKHQGVKYTSTNDDEIDLDLNTGEDYIDISPSPGTLVLFDSTRVPHAVRETHRSRRCVVGWLGSPN